MQIALETMAPPALLAPDLSADAADAAPEVEVEEVSAPPAAFTRSSLATKFEALSPYKHRTPLYSLGTTVVVKPKYLRFGNKRLKYEGPRVYGKIIANTWDSGIPVYSIRLSSVDHMLLALTDPSEEEAVYIADNVNERDLRPWPRDDEPEGGGCGGGGSALRA